MSGQWLTPSIDQLPLLLAGPILRRTEATEVTVWLALRQPCQITLTVYRTASGGSQLAEPVLRGSRSTVAIGQRLHLVAVTAIPLAAPLQAGQLYAYDLTIAPQSHNAEAGANPLPNPEVGASLLQALGQLTTTVVQPVQPSLSYFAHQLPTFALPPDRLSDLKLVHGSCRKPHGGGRDALPILDDLIALGATSANDRPHQLWFTGDQIYGDDVSDYLLALLTPIGDGLLGWQEALPIGLRQSILPQKTLLPQQLLPGHRSQVAERLGGFTAGLYDKPASCSSHLFSLGEYLTSYLLAWSPVLWQLPIVSIVGNHPALDDLEPLVATFSQTLGKVRRALANVPTYMIFDDHDVSDDWCLNQAWCERVFSQPLGRRTVQNALVAYALCQAWGNTPAQFAQGNGDRLLQAVQSWSASGGTDTAAQDKIEQAVGLPPLDPATNLPQFDLEPADRLGDLPVRVLVRSPQALTWHYQVTSPIHQVIVLDTRTWRGYDSQTSTQAPPMLLCPSAFERQIRQALTHEQGDRLTCLIAPTNLLNLEALDWIQHYEWQQGRVFNSDVGDAWNIHRAAFARLLHTLFEQRDRVVVLSGDIHYSFAARLDYQRRSTDVSPDRSSDSTISPFPTPLLKTSLPTSSPKVLVQFTASAFKNAEWKTQLVHTKLKALLPERSQDWLGWDQPPDRLELQVMPGLVRSVVVPGQPLMRLRSPGAGLDLAWLAAVRDPAKLPDWHYRMTWIKRQPVQVPSWGRSVDWLVTLPSGLKRWANWLWRNRWLQEGDEVVGVSNLGLLWFEQSDRSGVGESLVGHQDVFWYLTWHPGQIGFSRYSTPIAPLPADTTSEQI